MLMRTTAAAIAACMLMTASPSEARDHHRHRDRDRAIGAAIGLAIGGIAAAAARERGDGDGPVFRSYGGSFSPEPDVICYRDSRQCFRRGHYSHHATDRAFGYDPYRRGY